MKKTWITPHRALREFWMDSFDVLKLYLHRLPAKAAKVSGSQLKKNKRFLLRSIAGGKTYILQFQTSTGE